ncbi:acetyltransferase [Alteriqipengyuania sp.]|uniref:acetyltransferase n=1 Tax=Alteriqipengyuania sp. TaxID=2800692 RepID=UPI00351417B4
MIVRKGRPEDGSRVVAIWRAAVDATHGFLAPEDRSAIDAQVREFLPQSPMWIAECEGTATGFMVMDGEMIEALFVDPDRHGEGIGTMLVRHALAIELNARADANEQADNAAPFYRALGFEQIGRSPLDREGRPYPLLHFRHPGSN